MEILKQINPKLTFENIDYNLISLFDKFLHKKYDHPNTIGKYHKNFKHLLNILMKNGKIDENPYVSFKIKFIESNRQFLTKDEIERLEQLELSSSDKNLEIVKDMFLFSCFTGLRFSDISNLEKSNINRNGNEVNLKIRQQKTDGIVDLPLHLLVKGKAVGIISKYENNINEGKIFPTYLNKTVNKYLKVIQVLANIDKTLTYHISRHTFGTLLAIYTNDPLIIKQLMGHGDIKTSMGYIHLSNEVIKNKLKDVKW